MVNYSHNMPSKYRNSERRKERCRNAARTRRTKEAAIFSQIENSLPIPAQVLQQLDKISLMRIFTNTLRIRVLFQNLRREAPGEWDSDLLDAPDGFVLLLDQNGSIVYVSDNVTKYLGIPAMEMYGSSIYEYAHPCDHADVRDALRADDVTHPRCGEFLVRLKCALSATGRNVSVGMMSLYKTVKFSSRVQTEETGSRLHLRMSGGGGLSPFPGDDPSSPGSTPSSPGPSFTSPGGALRCFVLLGSVLPAPDDLLPLDDFVFVSHHSSTMKFTATDNRTERLLGYKAADLYNRSVFEFQHGADSTALHKAFSQLFSKGQTETPLYRMLVKGGGYVWVKTQATTISDKPGAHRPNAVICINYVISGVEEPELILSDHQMPGSTARGRMSAAKEGATLTDGYLVNTLRLLEEQEGRPLNAVTKTLAPLYRRASTASSLTTPSSLTPTPTPSPTPTPLLTVPPTPVSSPTHELNCEFNVDYDLSMVYEDLCLSDCMLSDVSVLNNDDFIVGDDVERMTDAVFMTSQDEELMMSSGDADVLPVAKQCDVFTFEPQGQVSGKKRASSLNDALVLEAPPTKRLRAGSSPSRRSGRRRPSLGTTSPSLRAHASGAQSSRQEGSILLNLLTTDEGDNYNIRQKRPSHPQSRKDGAAVAQQPRNIKPVTKGTPLDDVTRTTLRDAASYVTNVTNKCDVTDVTNDSPKIGLAKLEQTFFKVDPQSKSYANDSDISMATTTRVAPTYSTTTIAQPWTSVVQDNHNTHPVTIATTLSGTAVPVTQVVWVPSATPCAQTVTLPVVLATNALAADTKPANALVEKENQVTGHSYFTRGKTGSQMSTSQISSTVTQTTRVQNSGLTFPGSNVQASIVNTLVSPSSSTTISPPLDVVGQLTHVASDGSENHPTQQALNSLVCVNPLTRGLLSSGIAVSADSPVQGEHTGKIQSQTVAVPSILSQVADQASCCVDDRQSAIAITTGSESSQTTNVTRGLGCLTQIPEVVDNLDFSDNIELPRSEVHIQRYSPVSFDLGPESEIDVTGSESDHMTDGTSETPRPDYYLIRAERLHQLLAAAASSVAPGSKRNGFKK